MRLASFASLTTLLIAGALAAGTARADVGPRAPCPSGEHGQYLYGHHCVPDGSHMEQDAEGHMQVVKDGSPPTKITPPTPPAQVDPPKPPPATTFATPPAPTASSDAPPQPPPNGPAPEPPPQRGCACALGESPAGLTGAAFGLAALCFAVARRRSRASAGRSSS